MNRRTLLPAAALLLAPAAFAPVAFAPAAVAQTAHPLVGTWRITSYRLQVVGEAAGEPFGSPPRGSLVVTQGGRWIILVTGADRRPGTSDAERAALLQSMISYTGTWRAEGDRVVTEVDASWNEVYSGRLRTQVRNFDISGKTLTLRTGEIESAVRPGQRVTATLVFEREG